MIVFILSLLAFALLLLYRKQSPYSLPPGPYAFPLLGYIPFLDRVEPHKTFSKLADEYGDVFTIKLGLQTMVFLNTSETIREAMREDAFAARPNGMFIIDLWSQQGTGIGHGVILNTGSTWREQRRFMVRQMREFAFGKKSMEEIILAEVTECLRIMEEEVGQPIDFEKRFELAALNSLGFLTSGKRFSHDDRRLNDISEEFVSKMAGTNLVAGIACLFPFTCWLCPSLVGVHAVKRAVDEVFSIPHILLEYHLGSFKEGTLRDMTDAYIKQIKDTTDPSSSFYKRTGELNTVVSLMDMFAAGIETTAGALQWLGLYLIYYPDEQKKVQEEIRRVTGESRLPSLADRQQMPYTEAFISEVLRQSSFMPFSILHATSEDIEFRGWKIPKGTVVVPNTHHAHHDRRHWGDPHIFRPERFLNEEGQFRPDDGFVLFTPGKRQCVGELLGCNSLFLFLTAILQRFSVQSVPGASLSLKPRGPGVIIHPQPYKVVLSRTAS